MDHLEHLGGSIDGHQDMSKGALRATLQSADNGSLHFITSTGMNHTGREQEYIESTLLGTDLLSSQLPTNLLNEYINSVSSTTTSSIGMQSALMEHHYRPFGTSEELQSLNGETSKDGPGTKDIPGFNTLSSYDKMMNIGQSTSPISNGLAQIAGTIDSYVHFPLHATSSNGEAFDVVANALAAVTTHQQQTEQQHHQQQQQQQQQQHHHYSLPHASSSHLQHLQHQAQGHMHHHHHHHQNIVELSNSQQMSSLGHTNVPVSSSLGSLLPSVDVTLKAYSHNNPAMLPIASSAAGSTDMHNSSTMTITSMSLNESPKRFFSCTTLPSLITHNQRATTFSVGDSSVAAKGLASSVIDCEPRTHDEEMAECVASIGGRASCAQLGNINLPHKKRLAKKLGDTKETFCNDVSEMEQSLMLTNIQLSQRVTVADVSGTVDTANSSNYGHASALHNASNVESSTSKTTSSAPSGMKAPPLGSFSCQLCGKVVQDQLAFFNHLKEHYEPTESVNDEPLETNVNVPAISAAKNDIVTVDGKKAKPKLPRVKHTKKLKNDRAVKQCPTADESLSQTQNDTKAILSTVSNGNCAKTMESLLQNPALNEAMIVLECSENGGEFSETEDMLEGIRNVVQKVQETVDTDTNEELCIANSAGWYANEADSNGPVNATVQDPEKSSSLPLGGGSLDTHDMHMASGGDNFLLLLSKDQFNEAELLQTESTDSTLLKPLDAATCEQLSHTNSLTGSSPTEAYVAELQSNGEQNLQQMQTLHSTQFPFVSSVDSLSESHTVSFEGDENLPLAASMLLSSNKVSKVSVAPFAAPSQCSQMPYVTKARLFKREQKSDGDEDCEENAEQTSAYEQKQLTQLQPSDGVPHNGGESAIDGTDEQPLENCQFNGDDDEGAEPDEDSFLPDEHLNENEAETEGANEKERVGARSSSSSSSSTKLN
uniref:C2H2-type domain-containing protein n=1 Tax=Anopheles epiroticus TaxID=199890 RepID=A0A182PVR1_9DIPT